MSTRHSNFTDLLEKGLEYVKRLEDCGYEVIGVQQKGSGTEAELEVQLYNWQDFYTATEDEDIFAYTVNHDGVSYLHVTANTGPRVYAVWCKRLDTPDFDDCKLDVLKRLGWRAIKGHEKEEA